MVLKIKFGVLGLGGEKVTFPETTVSDLNSAVFSAV